MGNDLDHRQDTSDELIKSEKPSKDYMDKADLCSKCHGVKKGCTKAECPHR